MMYSKKNKNKNKNKNKPPHKKTKKTKKLQSKKKTATKYINIQHPASFPPLPNAGQREMSALILMKGTTKGGR